MARLLGVSRTATACGVSSVSISPAAASSCQGELPASNAGETKLLDEHYAIMIGIIEHDRGCLTATQHLVAPFGTPLPGK